jgi:hypothetical protein
MFRLDCTDTKMPRMPETAATSAAPPAWPRFGRSRTYVNHVRVSKVERETEPATSDRFFCDTPSVTGPAQVALCAEGLRVGIAADGFKVKKGF